MSDTVLILLQYPPHRKQEVRRIKGLSAIRDKFKGRCVYSGKGSKGRALCNIPVNSHSWRKPSQANPGFLCAKIVDGMFTISLGGKNGVRAHSYQFKIANLDRLRGGSYSRLMIQVCNRYGMQPVCDHPSYCRADDKALYIGQQNHIACECQRPRKVLWLVSQRTNCCRQAPPRWEEWQKVHAHWL